MHSKLAEYVRLLAAWPGLVSKAEDARGLVDDSLVLLPFLDGAGTVIDVGSGGGMPGIPLKLARPELELTLVEADRAKAAFLLHAAATLELAITVVSERAETAAHRPELREAFDVATCRALAPLPVAAELCLAFVRVGGRLLAMRSDNEPGWPGAPELGGGRPRIVPAPSALRERGVVVIIDKAGPAGARYPRRPGVPAKRPLGKL